MSCWLGPMLTRNSQSSAYLCLSTSGMKDLSYHTLLAKTFLKAFLLPYTSEVWQLPHFQYLSIASTLEAILQY